MMLIGTLALTGVGIPHLAGFAGFHSKDAIIEAAFAAHTPHNYAFWLLVAAAFMTSFYSWRLMFMTFHQTPRWVSDPPGLTPGTCRGSSRTCDDASHGVRPGGSDTARPRPRAHAAREPAGDAGAARWCWRSARWWPASCSRSTSSATTTRSSGARRCSRGRHNHILHDMHEVPDLGRLVGDHRHAGGLRARRAVLHHRAGAAGRDGARLQAALPVLPQQVVLRRALRLRSSSAGQAASAGRSGRAATAPPSTASSTAPRPACRSVTGRVVRLQTGYVYHYAFAMLIGVARSSPGSCSPAGLRNEHRHGSDPVDRHVPAAGRRAAHRLPATARRRATRAGSRCGRRSSPSPPRC